MVVFNGYISGDAYKCYMKNLLKIIRYIFFFSCLILLPVIIYVILKTRNWVVLVGYGILLVVVPLSINSFTLSKKNKKAVTPNKIYTEEDRIVSVSETIIEDRYICDVNKVIDHRGFYELVFISDKRTNQFICQKDLLTKGTLDEFECLFEGKIVRLETK